jgi:hypothetical protein
VNPAAPWRVIPSTAPGARRDRRSHTTGSNGRTGTDDAQFNLLHHQNSSNEAQAETDSNCFSIRSYLMARDSPDSDSTHLVGYSTCVPSGKSHLKSTLEDQHSEQ